MFSSINENKGKESIFRDFFFLPFRTFSDVVVKLLQNFTSEKFSLITVAIFVTVITVTEPPLFFFFWCPISS